MPGRGSPHRDRALEARSAWRPGRSVMAQRALADPYIYSSPRLDAGVRFCRDESALAGGLADPAVAGWASASR
jgi:hypothetical protein